MRDGLQIALTHGIRKLEIETDAQMIIYLLNNPQNSCHQYYNLLFDCRYLIQKFEDTRIRHVFREANKSADMIANAAVHDHQQVCVFLTTPNFMLNQDRKSVV